MNIHFPIAQKKDFDMVFQMMQRAKNRSYEEGVFQWDENYPNESKLLGDIEGRHMHLIKDDEGVVGFFVFNSKCEDDVHGHIQWINKSDTWVFFHRLCIDPTYQGKGYGQIVIMRFLEIVKTLGYESVRVDVFSTNETAIHIYKKYGFNILGECLCDRGVFYVFEKML